MAYRILLSGGGTGGHLVPALNLAAALQRAAPDVQVILVGARRGIEAMKEQQHDAAMGRNRFSSHRGIDQNPQCSLCSNHESCQIDHSGLVDHVIQPITATRPGGIRASVDQRPKLIPDFRDSTGQTARSPRFVLVMPR